MAAFHLGRHFYFLPPLCKIPKMKKQTVCLIGLMLCATFKLVAQETKPFAEIAAARAAKISEALKLNDSRKAAKVKSLIAQQYIALDRLQTTSAQQLKADKPVTEAIKRGNELEMNKLHKSYLKALGKELDSVQIDEVKNGMTYHTVPITYANYLLMLPYLSQADKNQILQYLTEGREKAMDAGTAKAKHAWFNNYKGKIANYLSSKGYQLKNEGEDWAKRRDTGSTSLEITESKKVMTALDLKDQKVAEQIQNLVAYQYQQIVKIQSAKQARIDEAKRLQKNDAQIESESQAAWEESKAKLDKQRDLFISELSKTLDVNQVETIKNEMTGQGLNKEYARFVELLPHLTDDHKVKVREYLIEARENALNVLTSRERNQWFAKYRGRANNYLSKQGYDLRKATEILEKKKLAN